MCLKIFVAVPMLIAIVCLVIYYHNMKKWYMKYDKELWLECSIRHQLKCAAKKLFNLVFNNRNH